MKKLVKVLISSFLTVVTVTGLLLCGIQIDLAQADVLNPLQTMQMDYSKAVDNGKLICDPKELDATSYKHEKDGLYPYPSDKTKFYQCQVNTIGTKHVVTFNIRTCPYGLIWNDYEKICDY